jgi:hypothetical protein
MKTTEQTLQKAINKMDFAYGGYLRTERSQSGLWIKLWRLIERSKAPREGNLDGR